MLFFLCHRPSPSHSTLVWPKYGVRFCANCLMLFQSLLVRVSVCLPIHRLLTCSYSCVMLRPIRDVSYLNMYTRTVLLLVLRVGIGRHDPVLYTIPFICPCVCVLALHLLWPWMERGRVGYKYQVFWSWSGGKLVAKCFSSPSQSATVCMQF